MSMQQLLFSFEGRIGRATYWYYVLAIIVVFVILGIVFGFSMAGSIGPNGQMSGGGVGSAIFGLVCLLSIWPSLAVQAKRWHDVDKSAWWILIGLVPAVGGLIALIFNGFIAGTPGPNQFGNPPA